jgi:hypothetical protein
MQCTQQPFHDGEVVVCCDGAGCTGGLRCFEQAQRALRRIGQLPKLADLPKHSARVFVTVHTHSMPMHATHECSPPAALHFTSALQDDLRPEMAMYGGKAITPNFDRFAELPGTVVFDRAYVQQAICCPTRSSFLTGRRPDTTKVWDLKTQFRVSGGANWTTLPQFFRERGYWTAGMGKVRQQQLLPSIALLARALHDDGPIGCMCTSMPCTLSRKD